MYTLLSSTGKICIFLDLGAGDHARLLNVQVNGLRQIVVQLDGHLLSGSG